jgi:3',5'-cyclic AMP phosphodiesterase CpdA
MKRPAPFRIAHLSDLHLTAGADQPRSEVRLFGRMRGMNAAFRALIRSPLLQRADLVLVTGDITDRGHGSAWRFFWRELEQAGLLDRCLVTPGNHDVCNLGLRPPAPRPDMVAADLRRARTGLRLGDQSIRFPWARVVDSRVVVIGLDSSNPGNLTGATNAVGELGVAQLEALARLLHKLESIPVKIVALHHSPNIPGTETAERRGVARMSAVLRWGHEVPTADRRALRLLCLSHRVRLIVHGHLHRPEDRRVNGVRIIGAPASTEPVGGESPSRYQIWSYTVQGSGGRVVPKLHSIAL